MKLFYSKLPLSFLALLILLCYSCETTERATTAPADKPKVAEAKPPEAKPPPVQQKPKQPPAVEVPLGPSTVVARIGDYIITRRALRSGLIAELRPGYDEDFVKIKPVETETVLMKMIAEKAMVIDARKQNYLEDERIQTSLKRFKEERLIRLLLETHLQDRIAVTDSEINEKMKTDTKLDRARAETMLKRTKAGILVNQFYSELYKKFHVQKLNDNFTKAAQIHQRLLLNPKTPQRGRWIRISQIRNELTSEEKNITLAEYDGGRVTLEDWFYALCEFSPPSRPKDLDTLEGVERLLDRTLSKPVFVAEAKARGLDRDENLLKQIKEREDLHLFGKAIQEKLKDIKDPTTEQIMDYFNKNKEQFGTSDGLTVDQIWCQDIETARKVKAKLDGGADFDSVKQRYCLEKERPLYTFPSREGIFFEDLWKAEPNEIVGPTKGFFDDSLKWRIVKVLEKKPGRMREYSNGMESSVKDRIRREQREVILAKYRKELLEKYPHRIYTERIADIDPLGIP